MIASRLGKLLQKFLPQRRFDVASRERQRNVVPASTEQNPLIVAVRQIDSASAFFDKAAKIVPHANINQAALDYLFSKRIRRDISKPAWEASVRRASALYSIMCEARQTLPWKNLLELEDGDELFNSLVEAGTVLRGTLLLMFHGGFSPAASQLFARCCKEGVVVGEAYIRDNSRGRTFAALNALRRGGTVLMSPDGLRGRQSAEFRVLDVTAPGGAGAAFLAHATGCRTAWYTAVQKGARFAPFLEYGPIACAGENLAEFSERLYRFYARKIEENFSGDPNNIVVSGGWAKRFALAAQRRALENLE